MKYSGALFSFFLFVVFLEFCKSDQMPKNKSLDSTLSDTAIIHNPRSVLWEMVCQNTHFNHLFDCNTLNCYQVELFQDPFKDLVILSLYMQDSLITKIYYNRFSFSRLDKKSRYDFTFQIIHPFSNDTLYCYHNFEKIKIIKIENSIDSFFKKLIWEMPPNDDGIMIDPESWIIKGRKDGKEIILKRHTFEDSLYYSNIQSLLDVFKIKDYEYKGTLERRH